MADASAAALLTWEDIVERVCVKSNYANLETSAAHWQNVFGAAPARGIFGITFTHAENDERLRGQLGQLQLALKKLVADSSSNWQGSGAAAFQQHVNDLAGAVAKIQAHYGGLHKAMAQSATHLRRAVHSIYIPEWLYGDVRRAQGAFHDTGTYSWWRTNQPWWTDIIYRFNGGNRESAKYWSSWFESYESESRRRYDELVSNYAADLKAIPLPGQIPIPGIGPGAEGGRGTKGPGAGKTNGLDKNALNNPPGGSGLTGPQIPAANAAGLTNPNLQTTTPPDLSALKPPGTDTVKLPTFPDPSTAGLAGLGGLGGGGLPGLGPAAGLPSPASGFGGPGAGARGLALAGAGGAATAPGMGMYPPMYPPHGGGHGAGAPGGGGKKDCLLDEDEVKEMFGFETPHRPEVCEPDEIPKNGVLEA